MTEPTKVGLIGCGYWGPLLIRNFKSLAACRLKTVCDLSNDRLRHVKNLYPDVECVSNPAQLLADDDLDAIVVATPVKYHYSLARTALLAGKHAFIEKPMASSSAECEELIQIAEDK